MNRPSRPLILASIAGTCLSGAAAAQFGPVFELSSLDGTNGYVINGIAEEDRSGFSVSSAGDFNGDGFDDIIIGAPRADPNGERSGQSYVVYGSPLGFSPLDLSLLDLIPALGFAINGADEFDNCGIAVSSAGDVNGDGFEDVLVGAYGARVGMDSTGASYVIFGGVQVAPSGTLELASLDGTNGFVLNGIGKADLTGNAVSSAGDVNGDGFDDILIGAKYADPNGTQSAGSSYVVFGGAAVGTTGVIDLASLDGSDGFVLNGRNRDNSGYSVSSAGDINGDGFDDVIIGAPNDFGGLNNQGRSYVVFGSGTVGSTGVIELGALDGSDGFVLNGIDIGDQSGRSVSSAGDVNGDGFDDVIIGAEYGSPNTDEYAGESYVVFGGAGVGSTGAIELSSLLPANGGDGSAGFVLYGTDRLSRSGLSVASAGDVNGDGFDDVMIGAYRGDPYASGSAGRSFVVFGKAGVGVGGAFELSSLLPDNGGDGMTGFAMNGASRSDLSGNSVSCAGDMNGDGIDDILIGAYRADANGNEYSGETYVVFGVRGGSCPADVNGDGVASPADFKAWLVCFNDRDLPDCERADVNNDGSLTPADFTAWLAAFNAGC